jgi:hypothetical protein
MTTDRIALPIDGACTGSASSKTKLAGVQVFVAQSALTALIAVTGLAQPTAACQLGGFHYDTRPPAQSP